MLKTALVLVTICGLVKSSGVLHAVQDVPSPVVTATSSQYFERTFNRLVAAPPVVQTVIPVIHEQPVLTKTVPVARPTQNVPVEPNVAIAIATAHAAAPVATILLPPYPFGLPPTINIIPQTPPINVPDDEPKTESTTVSTTPIEVKTTLREPEPTTPLPSNTDNSFAQALPSEQDVKFKQYFAPPLPPPKPQAKPQKVRTTVEIVPVPLAYIAPPPLRLQHPPVKYIHTFVPRPSKIIIRPVSAPLRIQGTPARLIIRPRLTGRNFQIRPISNPIQRSINTRDIEPTTFNPFSRPSTKPPRI